jgi:4'-phosphopantetheinyl transferase EntD
LAAPVTDNPAQLSPSIAALFPAGTGVVAAELRGNAPRELLTQDELSFINHCAPKRIDDFTAGRACARRALAELGISDFSLLSARDRAPIWPAGIVGSITHTKGFRASVVAPDRDLSSLGIDCEGADAVDQELWSRICAPPELERLSQLDAATAQHQASLIFAAKEAFYKCQYPLTREWVGFEDVVIDIDIAGGAFRVKPQKSLALGTARVESSPGRFLFRDQWVVAGIAVPRAT